MKVNVTRMYQAFDGKTFDSREACEHYEEQSFFRQFAGLKLPKIESTLHPDTPEERALANAVEVWAARIRANRLRRGERKRIVKPRGERADAHGDA